MKKIIFSVLLLISMSDAVQAGCDMCSMYLGLHPNNNKQTVGLRYRYSSYTMLPNPGTGAHASHGHTSGVKSERIFQTYELWSQLFINPKNQLIAIIPFSSNSIWESGIQKEIYQGMGDVQLLYRRQVYNTYADSANIRQRVFAGVGIKAPTGVYNKKNIMDMVDPHIQNGTGSTDLMFSVGHLLKYRSAGINTELLYKVNFENNLHYRFANRWNGNVNLFYIIDKEPFNIIPSLGTQWEYAYLDHEAEKEVSGTNGILINGQLGVDIYWKNFSLNLSGLVPVIQELNDPYTTNNYRLMTAINYSF